MTGKDEMSIIIRPDMAGRPMLIIDSSVAVESLLGAALLLLLLLIPNGRLKDT